MYNRNNNRGGRDVCKFFLEGRCRFGDSCKNEHPGAGGGGSGPSNGNRFAPLQNPSGGNARGRAGAVSGIGGQGQTSSQYGITADGIRLDLTDNSQKGERPQWEFSCYAPGIGAPRQLLEGPLEQSEEEMRVMCYLANATGQLQAYDQHVNGMRNEMTQQIQRILGDTEGAKRYVQEGEHQHPNRIDLVQKSNRDFPWENKPTVPPQQATPSGQTNGASSGFGQPKPAVPGFGQASSLGGASPFGQPSTLGGGGGASAFGQASNLGGVKPAFGQSTFGQPSQPKSSVFGQPSQPTSAFGQAATPQPGTSAFGQPAQPTASAFGQPSQPAASTFGQPSQPAASTFGQPSQPAASTFGQPSQPATNPFGPTQQPAPSAFGQPAQPAASAFGQPSQPAASAFGKPTQPAASPFGQASQPAATPFGQPAQPAASTAFGKPSPFGAAAPAAKPAFGASPFGQQASPSPFGQSSQTTTAFGQTAQPASGFGAASSQPPTSGFGAQAPAAAAAGNGGFTNGMLQGQRVYKGKDDQPMIKVRKDGVERETRVWFPSGPPTAAAPDTEGDPSAYEGEKGALLKACYGQVRASGDFPNGIMPECPPKREWVSFDL